MVRAVIISYRRGRHTQNPKQYLLAIEGVDSEGKAASYIGKKVVWVTKSGKKVHGRITALHGRKGVVRARFNKGLPGTALGSTAEILEST